MKIKLTLSIGIHNTVKAVKTDVVEVPDDEVPSKPEDVAIYLDELWKDWAGNYIDGNAVILNDKETA